MSLPRQTSATQLKKNELSEIAQERTLARLAQHIDGNRKFTIKDPSETKGKYESTFHDKYLTWGVIVDASPPLELGKDARGHSKAYEWVVKLKVVDPSLNFRQTLPTHKVRFYNHASISVYSNDRDSLPRVACLGDIIRLRRFSWMVNEYGDLMGFLQKFSNWLTYKGTGTGLQIQGKMNVPKNYDRQLTAVEKDRLFDLRKWSKDFFGGFSVRQITWWVKTSLPADTAPANPVKIAGMDLVLKLVSKDKETGPFRYVDEKGARYCQDRSMGLEITEGDVIKFRQVDVVFSSKGRSLTVHRTSGVLVIPSGFLDAKAFDGDFYTSNQERFEVKGPAYRRFDRKDGFQNKEAVFGRYPFLKRYYFEDHLIGKPEILGAASLSAMVSSEATIIHKDLASKLPVPVSFLMDVKGHQLKRLQLERFSLSVKITSFEMGGMEDVFHTVCRRCKTKTKARPKAVAKCCGEEPQLALFTKFCVNDGSYEKGQGLSLYVLAMTQEKNPFALWTCSPDLDCLDNWATFDETKMKAFRTKAASLTKFPRYAQMVVQAKLTREGKHFLQVADTYFLP